MVENQNFFSEGLECHEFFVLEGFMHGIEVCNLRLYEFNEIVQKEFAKKKCKFANQGIILKNLTILSKTIQFFT